MHYVAVVGGQERQVEIVEIAAGKYQLELGGKRLVVDALALRDDSLSLLIPESGQAYAIESERHPAGEGENLMVRGHTFNVEVVDLRTLKLRQAAAHSSGGAGPRPIKSPMPGKIVAVHVAEGQSVTEGQGLVVVEAMKMENELKAPKAGVVRQVSVQVGQAVEGGAVLCVVD